MEAVDIKQEYLKELKQYENYIDQCSVICLTEDENKHLMLTAVIKE